MGEEETKAEFINDSNNLQTEIEKRKEKLSKETDRNKKEDLRDEITSLQKRKQTIDGIIQSRYTPKEQPARNESDITIQTESKGLQKLKSDQDRFLNLHERFGGNTIDELHGNIEKEIVRLNNIANETQKEEAKRRGYSVLQLDLPELREISPEYREAEALEKERDWLHRTQGLAESRENWFESIDDVKKQYEEDIAHRIESDRRKEERAKAEAEKNPESVTEPLALFSDNVSSDKGATNESDLQASGTKKFVSEHNGQPLTRVEGLGMGQNQAKGVYVSFEPKNRYETENNKAKPVEVSLQNPIEFDQNKNEFAAFQQQTLIDRYDDFKVSDFSYLNEGEIPTIDNLNENGTNRLAGFVTEELKSKGHDGIVFSGEGEHEIVVFDKENVREKQPDMAIQNNSSLINTSNKSYEKPKKQTRNTKRTNRGRSSLHIERRKSLGIEREEMPLRDRILYDIASGNVGFHTNDKVSKEGTVLLHGLKSELGLRNSDMKAYKYLTTLASPKYYIEEYAQDFIGEGFEDDLNNRNTILDVLHFFTNPTDAMRELEKTYIQDQEEYYRGMQEALYNEDKVNNPNLMSDEELHYYISKNASDLIPNNEINIVPDENYIVSLIDNIEKIIPETEVLNYDTEQLINILNKNEIQRRNSSETETQDITPLRMEDTLQPALEREGSGDRSGEETGNNTQVNSNRDDGLVNERPNAIEQINRDALAQTEITEQPEKSVQEQLTDVGGDVLAHAKNVVKKTEVKAEESKVDTNPTEAQKEAGNYQKGHVNVQGFDISIENPKGSVRSGVDENGKKWNQEMKNTYGYIRGTEGKDGDHIDVFLGDNPSSDKVFVIDQVNPNTGAFDEHKAMIGFNSAEEARNAYLSNFEDGWKGFGAITETNVDDFGKWAKMDGRRIKPFSEYKGNIPEKPTYDGKDVLDFTAKVNDWNEKYLTGNEKLANQKDYDFDVSGITDANAQEMKAIKEKAKADGTFMKAPNGKDTNLNERDWLQVRTEGFKKFFGDWELANKLQMIEDLAAIGIKPHTYTREQLQQIYRDIENGKNKLDNRVVEFSHGVFGKMLRFGTDGNFAKIIPQLREVFNNSIPIYSESEQPTEGHKQHPNLVGFHNYLGKVKFGGNDYYVRFTVQEHRETTKNKGKRNPNELHNAFVSDVEIYNKTDVSEITDPRTTGRVTKTPVFVDAKLQQFFEKAREARENSSKVVDENGEPKPVTHSTNKEFTVFKNKQENDSGWLGAGYYFFGDRSLDGQYGENVMETFLNIKNPYYAAYKEAKRLSELNDRQASQEFTDELIGEGYDGVYFDGNLNQEWVAFSPNQIKSATENSGNFDINNNDIQFHFVGKKGAAALDKAEEANTRMNNLSVAKEMESSGKDAKAIKLATGWERGADGKWRYEIQDFMPSKKFVDTSFDVYENGEEKVLALSDAIENTELLKAYPELKGMPVYVIPINKNLNKGTYNGETIIIQADLAYYKGRTEIESTLTHEIQHAIQDIEGFARGGNPSAESLVPLIVDERRKVAKKMKDLAKSGKYKSEEYNQLKNRFDELVDIEYKIENPNDTKYGYELYKRLMGETEARNAQHRMNMTPEERRASLAVETEDVAREDQIFIENAFNEAQAYLDSQTESNKELEAADNLFNKELDDFKNKKHKGLLHLGKPQEILRAAGVDADELTLSSSVLNRKLKQHSLTTEDLKGLASAIQNPMLVYQHGEKNPNIVIVTEMDVRGKKLSVAVELDKNGNVVEVNNISSVHGKDAMLELERLSESESFVPKWIPDKEKVLNWLGIAHLEVGSHTDNSKHFSLAKIIRDFENPKLSEQKNAFTPAPKEKFDALIEKLKQNGLAADVITDKSEYDKAFNEASQQLKDKSGTVYGFVKDGKVYLDPTKMNYNTPIHEFGHLWNKLIKESNSELWNKGVELIKQSEYWKKVNDDPFYKDFSEERKIDEALAMAIGDKGEMQQKAKDVLSFARLKTWLNDAWSYIKGKFGIDSKLDIENMTLDDFTNKAVKDLTGRKELKGDGNLESEPKNNNFAENNIVDTQIYEDQSANKKSVKVVSINPSEIIDENGNPIDLNNTPALRNWLLSKYQGKEVQIKDDGKTVAFYRKGIESSIKRRGDSQRQMYSDLERLVENGVYAGYEKGDAKHDNIDRQNIYYSSAKIGDKVYGVRFKIDIYKGVEKGQYKDHKIAELEIEKSSSLYAGFDPYQQNDDLFVAVPKIKQAFEYKGTNNFNTNQENINNSSEPRSGDVMFQAVSNSEREEQPKYQPEEPLLDYAKRVMEWRKRNPAQTESDIPEDKPKYDGGDVIEFAKRIFEWNRKQMEAEAAKMEEEVNKRSDFIGISHDWLNDLAQKIGLKPLERGGSYDPEELADRGRKLLQAGADPNQIADDFHTKGMIDENVVSTIRAHKAVKDLTGGKELKGDGNLESESRNANFAENNLVNNERTEAGLDNRTPMERSTENGLVGRPEKGSGIYRTISAANNAGNRSSILPIEEREELESRGINPDWDRVQFFERLEVIDTPKHDFKNISEARTWAKENVTGTYHNKNTSENIIVSRTAIEKYLSESAIRKSVSLDVHLSTLKKLPQLIETSILKESKQDRDNNKDIKEIQRFYGAIKYDNEQYPVKITVKAYPTGKNNAYSYEVMQIESPITQNELSGQSIQSENLEREQYPTSSRHSGVSTDKGTNNFNTNQENINNSSELRSGDVMFQAVPNNEWREIKHQLLFF